MRQSQTNPVPFAMNESAGFEFPSESSALEGIRTRSKSQVVQALCSPLSGPLSMDRIFYFSDGIDPDTMSWSTMFHQRGETRANR